MAFRIAIGSCRCANGVVSRNALVRELCSRILARLQRLRSFAPQALANLPSLSTEVERIDGRRAELHTYLHKLDSGDALVIVQGFLRSWRFPNYISFAGVGYIYAEGILVSPDGGIREAEENLLWAFR